MTIYDISKKSGVSIATVSRVINGKKGVSDATRRRVLSVMNEKGYTPNAFARGLGLRSIKTVGVMCMDVADIYLAAAVSSSGSCAAGVTTPCSAVPAMNRRTKRMASGC